MDLWKYLLLTVAVELPVVVIWLRHEWKRALKIALLLNLFTWPLLVTLAQLGWNIPIMEIGVVLVEGYGYQLFFKRGWKPSMIISVLANGLSYGLGLLAYYASK